MSATNCACPCPDPTITEIPGAPGADGASGADGADGVNAYTLTTADITLPAAAGPVVLPTTVADSSWMGIGQIIFISDGTDSGHFEVLTTPSGTSVTLEWLQYPGDAVGTTVIGSGATVSPSGTLPVLAAPLPTALTDNTTGAASNTLAAGVGQFTLSFHINLPGITGAQDVITDYTPGYAFKIISVAATVITVGSPAAKAVTLNLEIGSTNVTGGEIALTSANTTPVGATIAGTAVTAANVGTNTDTLSVEASAVTAFSGGDIDLQIQIQNMDTANAVASLADHINDLITSLT